MDWVQIGSTFGIPVLLLIGMAYFGVRQVWPFITKRIELNDARHQIETDKFLAAVDKLANAQVESAKAHAESSAARDRVQAAQNEAINNLTQAIKALQQVRGRQQ